MNTLGTQGLIAARTGNREDAERFSNKLKTMDHPYSFGQPLVWQARIASILGEKELAVNLLKEAVSKGYSYVNLYFDFDLEPLYEYPLFQELIKPKGKY